MPYTSTKKIVEQTELEQCCEYVDELINTVSVTAAKSRSLSQAQMKSRSTLMAATRIIHHARQMQLPIKDYISVAIEAAELLSRSRPTITSISNKKIQVHITNCTATRLLDRQTKRGTPARTLEELGTPMSVLASIRTVMDAWHVNKVGQTLAYLIGMRTILDAALLYSVPTIQKMVDTDALSFTGHTRASLRAHSDKLIHDTTITSTPEWRWWCSHIPDHTLRRSYVALEWTVGSK